MSVKVTSGVLAGIDGMMVDVEVDMHGGVGHFDIVGLPEASVRESRVRVTSALRQLGHRITSRWITVNLAPADLRKTGSLYDLPIAVGVLACMDEIPVAATEGRMFVGELSLDGELRPVPGVLPMAAAAREAGMAEILVPIENAREAAVVSGIRTIPTPDLTSLIRYLAGDLSIEPAASGPPEVTRTQTPDLADVRGQAHVKRALEIAAAGRHNLLMIGPPGCGKTMLARRIVSILPPMTYDESLETSRIYSVAGLLRHRGGLITDRPFRTPHHGASSPSIVGGGSNPRPGEVSLAHNGVLFMDELPEWKREVLEVLRQPLEEREVTISRVRYGVSFPADFLLIASMNPCPCGYLGDSRHECSCTSTEIARYRSRVSGPLLDRIDLQVEVSPVPFRELSSKASGSGSIDAAERVMAAAAIQARRFKGSGVLFNGRMDSSGVRRNCAVPTEAESLLEHSMDRLGLSARALDRILKVARTIADLDGSERIRTEHVAEAIQYRMLDRLKGQFIPTLPA
ncbi:MAG TPA: YifB family Mg chelatase-like AAA ATPase [Myxococcota bacterium]|nr:YifB family Mg chelatase-like AAA ATPase [Myxococcota bacterium]HOA13875.1 YifB family Mg chelatase-like AAA ATPase [Myxococcota bacterium]HOH76391.1 YifB family Mg chelatase-like AAA ATPase [Myxococcota bacterium]